MFLYLCSIKSWQWALANACVSSLISPYLCVLISKITRYLINAWVHIDMSSLISPYLCVCVSKMIFDCINAKVLTHVISLINFIYSYMYDMFTQRFMFFISVRFLIHIIGFIHFIGPNVCVLWFSSASSMLEFTYAYSVLSVSQVQTRVSGFLNIQVTHYAKFMKWAFICLTTSCYAYLLGYGNSVESPIPMLLAFSCLDTHCKYVAIWSYMHCWISLFWFLFNILISVPHTNWCQIISNLIL